MEGIYKQERRSGKTTQLIVEMCRNKKSILVVHSIARARYLKEEFPLLKDRIYTVFQIFGRSEQRGCLIDTILFDEVELCLAVQLNAKIVGTCS